LSETTESPLTVSNEYIGNGDLIGIRCLQCRTNLMELPQLEPFVCQSKRVSRDQELFVGAPESKWATSLRLGAKEAFSWPKEMPARMSVRTWISRMHRLLIQEHGAWESLPLHAAKSQQPAQISDGFWPRENRRW
jgi:hypothetical protein